MNLAEKKETWRLLGAAIDGAAEAGVPAELFLTRFALLCALELPSLGRVRELIELAHEAGRANAADVRDMRAELAVKA